MDEHRMPPPWRPTPQEVEQILVEMRPIIRAFAARARAGAPRRPVTAA